MRWLDRNEGMIMKILSIIFLGFGAGQILNREYYLALESGLMSILIYMIYRAGSNLDKHL
ncbi:hypothetical protein ACFFK0_02770 [Paenibacillus chartarius]|uniref:Uncharacterized protein n=1 Tax=Paenibacillus chartarius TaxID=747481 RepID=A0ABV6DFF8_9BACL